jgi:glutathione S-transferase
MPGKPFAAHRGRKVTSYRLHYIPESGNSYKVALMLALCGQAFELIWTDFAGGETRQAAWRENVNEMGEIPVLEEDGLRLAQTAPILLRLAARHGRFGGESEEERSEILRWLFWDNHKLTGYMATYRFLRAFTPTPDPAVLKYFRRRLDDFLGILDKRLRDRSFIIGERPTIADVSMVGYMLFPTRETGYDFDVSHPSISAWRTRISALPGWRAPYDLMPGKRMKCYAAEQAT